MPNFRHGDVAIKQIVKLPKHLKKLNTDILAYGEATGHHHKLVADRLETRIDILEDTNGNKFFRVVGGQASLIHQEHDTITLQPGIFKVGIEREYDTVQEWRRVQD